MARGRQEAEGKGRPLGQTLAHAYGDANAFWYPYLWSWGGKEVEADGKTVVLDSPATLESIKFAVGLWKDACDEGGLAWDDSGNNRAFLSGSISATNNGASIYIESKKSPIHTRPRTASRYGTTSSIRHCRRDRPANSAGTCRKPTW